MERPCDYNEGVICDSEKCYHCGWDPEVAKKRQEELRRTSGEKQYKINFRGYCEVWAKSPEDAAKKAEDIESQFFAHYEYGEPICLDKEETDEMD